MILRRPAKGFAIEVKRSDLRHGALQREGWCRVARACSRVWFGLAALALTFAGAGVAWGQAAAEYGGATASMGAVGTSVRPTEVRTSPSPAPQGMSGITLPARSGPPPDVANRQALQKQAGSTAAKLLLRSDPSNARVWIDGKFVGRTPLLLLVPPGKHLVQMQGDRQEQGAQQVDLLAHQTRDIEVRLTERYPTTVNLAGMQ